ncbi:MAG: hypothetical protein FWB86_13095 [Treponema sp.]|nr:hypothetical protein [Treponema sp.]
MQKKSLTKISKLLFVSFLFFFALIPLETVSANIFSWALHGNIFYFAADNGVDSDPAPIIPSGGFSLALQLMKHFKIEFTEDIYFTNYQLNTTLGYPMACNQEERSALVIGFITAFQATGFFPIGSNGAVFRVFGGPAADLRIVTLAVGLNHPSDFQGDDRDAQKQTDAIRNFFWSEARWFMPVAGFGFDFPINEKFLLGFDLRTWFPVYKLWTNDNTPAIDGWRFGANLRITVRNSI